MTYARAFLISFALLALNFPGAAGDFDYEILVRPGDRIGGRIVNRVLDYAVSPSGVVAAVLDQTTIINNSIRLEPHEAIWLDGELIVETGDLVSGETLLQIVAVDVNDSGEVVFDCTSTSGERGVCTPSRRIIANDGEFEERIVRINNGPDPRINNRGSLGFWGQLESNPFQTTGVIFTLDQILVEDGDVVDGRVVNIFNRPDLVLGESGEIGFLSQCRLERDCPQGRETRLFVAGRSIAATGDLVDGRELSSIYALDFNQRGDIVFGAGWFPDGNAVFKNGRIVAKRGDVVEGVTLTSLWRADINASGQVAYGTFDRSRLPATFVIGLDDEIVAQGGMKVEGFELASLELPRLDDFGDVYFLAQAWGPFSGPLLIRASRPADLSLTKSASSATARPGRLINYLLLVEDKGPGAARNVVLRDSLSRALKAVSYPEECGLESGELVRALGDLRAGEKVAIEYSARVSRSAGEFVTNRAVVSSDRRDPVLENNTAETRTTVQIGANLRTGGFLQPGPLVAGESFSIQISLGNAGSSPARGSKVTLTHPTFATLTGAPRECLASNGQIGCSVDYLQVGRTKAFVLDFRADSTATGQATFVIRGSSDTPEEDPSDNTAVIERQTVGSPI